MQVAGYILTPCVDKNGKVVATDLKFVSCVDMGGKMTKSIRYNPISQTAIILKLDRFGPV